jgi:hypothetical protein
VILVVLVRSGLVDEMLWCCAAPPRRLGKGPIRKRRKPSDSGRSTSGAFSRDIGGEQDLWFSKIRVRVASRGRVEKGVWLA